jgi:branched-subunit amino acid transport protein
VAFAANYLWRGLGVAISGHISPAGSLFKWISCVAYALLAGLIARIIVLPVGLLAATPLIDRLGAVVVAMGLFFLFRRNLVLGTVAGVATIVALALVRAS